MSVNYFYKEIEMDKKQEESVEKLVQQIGQTLRMVRQERNLSLQELADISAVSKLTLGKVERGEANPSLSVIWKIANSLGLPISTLMNEKAEVVVVRNHEGNRIVSENGACSLEPMFDSTNFRSMELHRAFLQPNSDYHPGAHQAGVIEYVTVMEGEAVVVVDQEEYVLNQYDSIKFRGDRDHTYKNLTQSEVVLHFVMTYM